MTLPSLMPVLLVIVMIRVIDSLKMFDIIYILTARGGPGTATQTLGMLIYNTGFVFFQTSRAAALGILMVLLVMPVYWLWRRAARGACMSQRTEQDSSADVASYAVLAIAAFISLFPRVLDALDVDQVAQRHLRAAAEVLRLRTDAQELCRDLRHARLRAHLLQHRIVITLASTLLCVAVATLAAYALARARRFPRPPAA